jgi:hypothetical protein
VLLVDRLPEEFFRFCDSIPGAERIDSLPFPSSGLQKADYFFRNRTIICEVKTLETDTNDKITAILLRAGISLEDGVFDLEKLLEGHSRAEALYWKCVNAITTSVKQGMDTANRQIADTKKAFGISEADGLWVIIHPKVHVLNPDIILTRIRRRLRKRNEAGGSAYDQITQLVLFSEIHKLKLQDGTLASAVIPVLNTDVPEKFGVSSFVNDLSDGWAKWNGRRSHTIHASQLNR